VPIWTTSDRGKGVSKKSVFAGTSLMDDPLNNLIQLKTIQII